MLLLLLLLLLLPATDTPSDHACSFFKNKDDAVEINGGVTTRPVAGDDRDDVAAFGRFVSMVGGGERSVFRRDELVVVVVVPPLVLLLVLVLVLVLLLTTDRL